MEQGVSSGTQRHAGVPTTDVKPGHVVLVHDQDNPRGFWKMGQIEKLIVGCDGLVRGSSLRLPPQITDYTATTTSATVSTGDPTIGGSDFT